MSKSKKSVRQTNIAARDGIGQQLEHTEVFEDNLLPDASEIERLQRIDPGILQWLKERAEKEQEFRHHSYQDKVKIIENQDKGTRRINTLGMILAFIIIAGGLVFSYFLVQTGSPITGTIFSGATLILAGSLFVGGKNSNGPPPSKSVART
jgi:uncharacterized membrane protein